MYDKLNSANGSIKLIKLADTNSEIASDKQIKVTLKVFRIVLPLKFRKT